MNNPTLQSLINQSNRTKKNRRSDIKIGLVLAGGGAKGAYEAGALKYMAEVGFAPEIIAGTSIGALNGAVLASHKSFVDGVEALDNLWDTLGSEKLLKINPISLKRVAYSSIKSFFPTFNSWLFEFLSQFGIAQEKLSIFASDPIENLLKKSVDPVKLRQGIELWVAVFPTLNIPGFDYDYLTALLSSFTGSQAHWLKVQDCPNDELLYSLLLASAAIPFAFPPRKINGTYYVDGALGDNIPLGALAAQGCTHAIVIHLGHANNWSRHKFPQQAILEIRPTCSLKKHKAPILSDISSLLDFSAERISELKQMGYEDAKYYLDTFFRTWNLLNEQRLQRRTLIETTIKLYNDQPL